MDCMHIALIVYTVYIDTFNLSWINHFSGYKGCIITMRQTKQLYAKQQIEAGDKGKWKLCQSFFMVVHKQTSSMWFILKMIYVPCVNNKVPHTIWNGI